MTFLAQVLGSRQRATAKTEEGRRDHEDWTDRERLRRYLGDRYGARAKTLQVRVVSERLGLQGILDAVVAENGLMIPFDLKNTKEPDQPWPGQRLQAAAYAMLLEESYPGRVAPFALVHYLQSGTTRRLVISGEDREQVMALLEEMRAIRQTEEMPPRAAPARCTDCGYRNRCV
jgi:CRISPR-associated protein Cas4